MLLNIYFLLWVYKSVQNMMFIIKFVFTSVHPSITCIRLAKHYWLLVVVCGVILLPVRLVQGQGGCAMHRSVQLAMACDTC